MGNAIISSGEHTMKDIAIIGGGASGLMAACFAAGNGTRVTIYEKQKKTGRKLLATGNGRCNITNSATGHSRYHGHNPRFVQNIFRGSALTTQLLFLSPSGSPSLRKVRGKCSPRHSRPPRYSRSLNMKRLHGVSISSCTGKLTA